MEEKKFELNEPENTELDSSLISDTEDMVEEEAEEVEETEKKVLFLKAAQGYGMILGFGAGYILSGLLTEIGIPAGKFECVILCMFAGMAIGYLISKKKEKK